MPQNSSPALQNPKKNAPKGAPKKRKNKDQKFSGLGHKLEIMTRIWVKVGFPSPGWGGGLEGPWTWDLQGLTWDHPGLGPARSGYLGSA